MISKTSNFHKRKDPLLVGEAPFSGFYSGFYFVPLYALQHMYHGVSPKSRYFSYNLLIKKNRGGLSSRSRLFLKHKKDFTPRPNLYFSKIFFHKYFGDWLTGKKDFLGFKPNTFFYDFFLGLFFFFIWQLGGGFRLSPLYDPTKHLNVFGFYDLRITPLAVIFKFYVKLSFFYGYTERKPILDYYFFNRYSLTRGFIVPYSFHEKINWARNVDPLSYFFFPILTIIPELVFSFIFHFFIRFFLHHFYSFIGGLIFNYENKITLFDHFWLQLYAYYIDDVCSLLRTTGRPLKYRLRLKHISTISTFYHYQSNIFSRYWRRKFYRIFSEYGVSEFIFSNKFSLKLYRTKEYEKMSDFKLIVLLHDTKPYHLADPKQLPDTASFFKSYFFAFSHFGFGLFKELQKLRQIPSLSKFSPFFDKTFLERFQFYTYQEAIAVRSSYTWRYHDLRARAFRHYKYRSNWFKSHFTNFWPYNSFSFLGFESSFFEIIAEFFHMFLRFIGYIWIFIGTLPFINHITVYFYNCCVKLYRSHLSSSDYRKSNFIFRFFGYFFFTWFGATGFNIYIKVLNSSLTAFKNSVKILYYILKRVFLFFYGWYSYFFWLFFRPLLTIIFFLYLEFRFFFLFSVELVRYYRFFSLRYYYYSVKEAYFVGFRKFFLASKFFRFFTREIGEDLEETPYNNDQDLEDDYISDYLSDFPAYEDFQSVTDRPDHGYSVTQEDFDFIDHHYDYWHSRSTVNEKHLPAKPNLEFFAENYFEQENDLFFQLFCIWTSPTLFDFKDYSSTIPPYYKKDTYDITSLNPRSWYPLELTQDSDYEEDQVEYFVDATPNELEVSESTSSHIIPFDSDRARLSKFTKFYQKKLAVWHSYQINNNFSKIPDSLKYLPIPRSNLPNSVEHWKTATKAVSRFFFTPAQHKKFAFKFETLPELELVWSRISYEVERNPRKFYDFLSDSKNSHIFDDLQFHSSKKGRFFGIFTASVPETSSFVRYLNDYFSGYADLSQMQKNKHFYSRNMHHNLFVINFLNYLAISDHKNFISKFMLLSQFPHFSEIQRAFDLFIKHGGERVLPADTSPKKISFLEEIYAARMSQLGNNYSPPLSTDYWREDDGIFLWFFPNPIRRFFVRTVNFLAFRTPFRPTVENLYSFYRKIKRRKKKKLKKKKINKNDLLKVFAVWCRHERDILLWRFSNRGNRDHYNLLPYVKNEDNTRSATYEKIFSTFLFDSYLSVKNSASRFNSAYKSFMFRNYRPDGLFFQYTDGEDYSVKIKEKLFQKTFLKRRAYFTYNQVTQGSVWGILNPALEEFFYEVYYLNNAMFFPAAFNDYNYADFFPDDYIDSGLDIYDDYIFVSGDQDFYRPFGEGSEDLIISPDDYGDEDTDTLEVADEMNWRSDEYMDYDSSADEGLSYGDETGGENAVQYLERFWFNSDWFFFSEHTDSDEGFEEWEPDEFDSMYDLDHSVDRLFFGALKRKGHFPATDQRVFLGTLHDDFNIDKDLDYTKNFEFAQSNAESKELTLSHIPPQISKKNYFNFFKLYVLALFRFILYVVFAVRGGLLVIFFSNFDNPKYVKLLKIRAHYLNWYSVYTSFHKYKDRLDDWVNFFEEFKDNKIFFNYVNLNKKNFISEPHTSLFTNDPYGRFWFQFPFNNHLRDFSYYTSVNLLETDYQFEDLRFKTKNGKFHLNTEEQLDKYQTDTSLTDPGSDLSGIERNQEFSIYKAPNRFFSSDSTININFFKSKYREKLDHITSFPWFADRAKIETVGSDFTYLDFMFVDDMPEDDEFMDEEAENHPFYTYNSSFYYKYIERNRYGAARSQYLPNDGTLDGLSLEEVDWDIGSLVSFSSDDFNTHLEDFSEIYDLYAAALSDWLDLVYDYFFYSLNIKFKKFILGPFKYWETSANSGWLALAADYGLWVLIVRNFINISLFCVLAIYGFFTLTRLSYYFFGEFFSYGLYGLLIFIVFFSYLIFILRFIFKSVNDFYKSFDLEEKIAIYAGLVVFFYVYNLNGYMRNPAHFAWSHSGSSSTRLLQSNNHSADWRRIANDWYPESGFQQRPELNYQGWFTYKLAPTRPGYYYEEQNNNFFEEEVNPDRQIFGYSLNLASYPTYFNPYNIYNFIKFQVFNVTNENFVGYTKFRRSLERNNVLQTVDHAYTALHRPHLVNWLHMSTSESSGMAKKEMVVQGALAGSSSTLFSYSANTLERKKYNNHQFVNPINQSKVWTPYSPISVPRSSLPYDFRPKRFTEGYNLNASAKLNSLVYSNHMSTLFNKNLMMIDDIPDIVRRDVHGYKNHIDADGDFLGTAKTRKYIRSSYKLFNKKNFFVSDNFYEKSVQLRWYQIRLSKTSFLYKYSDNLRKYLFLYNPHKAKPLRDAYMLSFKDLVPYPEFLGHGKNNLAKFTKSEYFRFLDSKQKKLYFSILEAETIESANTLIQHITLYPKSGTSYKFYFNAIDSTRFPLDYYFFEEYVSIYNSIINALDITVTKGAHRTNPRSFGFYYKLKFPIIIDNFKLELREFISNSRLENIDKLTNFFTDYFNFKQLRYKNFYNLKPSQIRNIQYETKLVQANRIRRSKLVSSYFRVAKAANKQALADYARNSIVFINPYKEKAFSNYASYDSFSKGIARKKNQLAIFDPFYNLKSKDYQYRSSLDNRLKIYNSEADYQKPVFDLEKRLNRRLRKKRFINKYAQRYMFGWHEYWYVEATLWNIFLDFIMVRDLLENADSIHGLTFEDSFDYKFSDYHFNLEARKFPDRSKYSIINFNSAVEKKSARTNFVDNYLGEQSTINSELTQNRWEGEYDDDEFMEAMPRYTYADKIGGVDRPPLRTDRFDFRKPHFFTRLRSEHWSALARDPSPFERQRKPFFGVSIKDEAAVYFEKKFETYESDDFPFHMVNHILRSYIWFNTLQRSRIIYKKTGDSKTYPYNQKFISLFTETTANISDYVDEFASPLDVEEWRHYKDKLFVKSPLNFLAYKKSDEMPPIFKKQLLWQNNPDFDHTRVDPKIIALEKNVALRSRMNFIKTFLQDKKNHRDFIVKSYKISDYFTDLQKQSGFDTRGQIKVLMQKDTGDRYRDYFFHGIIRPNEEKGRADIVLLRAKRRKQIVKIKDIKPKNEKS